MWYKKLLFFCIFASFLPANAQQITVRYTAMDSSFSALPKLDSLVMPFRLQIQQEMDKPLTYLAEDLLKAKPMGKLGQFCADALLQEAKKAQIAGACKAQIAVLTPGGLRKPLAKGVLTRGDLFELMPFENALSILEIKGSVLQELVAYIVARQGLPFAGMTIQEKNGKIAVKINQKNLQSDAKYCVATLDYLASGGDGMDLWQKADKRTDAKHILFRNMLMDAFSQQDTLRITLDPRIILSTENHEKTR